MPARERPAPHAAGAALLIPLALVLAACADGAPLDTLEPQGPQAS